MLSRLVAVEYEKPVETFQELLDNKVLLMMPEGTLRRICTLVSITLYLVRFEGTTVGPQMSDSVDESIRQVYAYTLENGGIYHGIPMPKWVEDKLLDGSAAV